MVPEVVGGHQAFLVGGAGSRLLRDVNVSLAKLQRMQARRAWVFYQSVFGDFWDYRFPVTDC